MLLIEEDFEQARVLVALLVSIAFLALHLAVKPLRRPEDGVLMTFVELALIFTYTCVLLLKTCNISPVACATFGFGESPRGLYLLFVLTGLVMLLLLLVIGATLCLNAHDLAGSRRGLLSRFFVSWPGGRLGRGVVW